MAGAATWHRILDAIERLQATKPAEGEAVKLTWPLIREINSFHEIGDIGMGRKPISKKAMTAAERQRRRYERQRPIRQLARLTTAFLAAEETARAAFIEWLRKHKFLR